MDNRGILLNLMEHVPLIKKQKFCSLRVVSESQNIPSSVLGWVRLRVVPAKRGQFS